MLQVGAGEKTNFVHGKSVVTSTFFMSYKLLAAILIVIATTLAIVFVPYGLGVLFLWAYCSVVDCIEIAILVSWFIGASIGTIIFLLVVIVAKISLGIYNVFFE